MQDMTRETVDGFDTNRTARETVDGSVGTNRTGAMLFVAAM